MSMYRQLVIAAACVMFTTTAQAQLMTTDNKPFSFGGALGAAAPVSDLSSYTNTGYNGTIILGLNTPSLPVSFRIDGAYNAFGYQDGTGNEHSTSLTGNVVLPLSTQTSIRPYLIGGVGVYNTGTTDAGVSSVNNLGFNVGGGITIPLSGFNAFVEARYNYVPTDFYSRQFVPVVFGVMF